MANRFNLQSTFTQSGRFSLLNKRKQPRSDRDILAGALYAEANPNDPTEMIYVADTIFNRGKMLSKDPMSILSNGYTSVGRDKDKRFLPFLAGKVDSADAQKRAYQLADELLSGQYKPASNYTSFRGDGRKNTFFTEQISRNSFGDPDEWLRSKFVQEVPELLTDNQFGNVKSTGGNRFDLTQKAKSLVEQAKKVTSFNPLFSPAVALGKKLPKSDYTSREGQFDLALNFTPLGVGSTVGKAIKGGAKAVASKTLKNAPGEGIVPKVDALTLEARKYKTAEEFVRAKANLKHRSVTPDIQSFKPNEKGIFFTKNAYGERLGMGGGKGDVYITNAYVDLKNPFLASEKNVVKLYQKNYGLELSDAKRLAGDFSMGESTARQQVRGFVDELGHDGMIIPNDWDGGFGEIKSIVAFDPSQIKTKSQLTDLWSKATKTAPLATSIKSAKQSGQSFDEWVKGHGETVYRTGQIDKLTTDDILGKSRFFADRPEMAKMYGGQVNEAVVSVKKPFVISERAKSLGGKNEDHLKIVREKGGTEKFRQFLKENGYDGIKIEKDYGNEIIALDKAQIKTRSQLKAEWDGVKAVSQPATQAKQAVRPKLPAAFDTAISQKVGAETVANRLEGLRQTTGTGLKEESFDYIIKNDPTPVKDKVGIIDYLRTPDRVLKKLGMEQQYNDLRTAYEGYLKELPQNIDKITDWAKQLPKESSQRVFKFLDGQEIKLTQEESKVAGEVQDWLRGWAKRLGLPDDKRISNYITHIFEPDFIAKEFDENIAKLIRDKIPGSVYDPFLEKRLGKQGFVEDAWRALDAYVKRGTRKAWLDPVLEDIKRISPLLEDSQFQYIQKYISNINLRPTDLDNLVDNQIKQIVGYKFGQRPVTNLLKKARQAVYRAFLGLNVGSAVKNLTQGVNTYALLGEKHTIKGYAKALLNWNSGELDDVGVLGKNFIEDRALSATRKFWQKSDKVLFSLFEMAERMNRGAAYFGAKSKGLAKGMSQEEAVKYAKGIVQKTQFLYDPVDTAVAFRGDVMKTLLQFASYPVRQTEFLAELVKNKEVAAVTRYTLGGLAVALSVGKAFGYSFKDMIPSFRFGVPPALGLPTEIGKAVLDSPDRYGQPVDTTQKLKNIAGKALNYVPASTQAKKTIGAIKDISKGKSTTASGKTRFKVGNDLLTRIRAMIFGTRNLPQAREYYDNFGKPKTKKKTTSPSGNRFNR